MTPVADTEHYSAYAEDFARLEAGLNGQRGAWVHSLRQEGFRNFEALGFPTTRVEEWRHTSVAPIQAATFRRAGEARLSLEPEKFAHFAGCPVAGTRIVFVNGRYAPELSQTGGVPSGIRVASLAETLRTEPQAVEPHLGRLVAADRQAFAALNTAFLEDGAFVHIGRWRAGTEPIVLLNLSTGNGSPDEPAVAYPRTLIVADEGSTASLIEVYAGIGEDRYFTNAVTEVVVGEGAVLNHVKVQRESPAAYHVGNMTVRQAARSTFSTHSISLGGGLVRNDLHVRLDGPEADATLNGLYAAGERRHVDNHTVIEHAAERCSSREVYHGILSGAARGVFAGRIIVRPGAQQTDARQSSRNLLLSKEAVADAMPQLEIFADDVKCTHGATVGCLDEDAIFYLRSRGVPETAARGLLTFAFANEIVQGIPVDALRSRMQDNLLARFTQMEQLEGNR